MEKKKYYIAQLASFLVSHKMKMSGEELAEHLNRNNFLTSYGTEYQGGRGTYKLIKETYHWLESELNLSEEAQNVAKAYVKPDGSYAYKE
jgi:hypothetical protein